MLRNVLRFKRMASKITERPGVSSAVSEASRAAAVDPETAVKPFSFCSADASLTP
jgi:hypothetical protein